MVEKLPISEYLYLFRDSADFGFGPSNQVLEAEEDSGLLRQ